jgi:hypothetical protein
VGAELAAGYLFVALVYGTPIVLMLLGPWHR